MPKGLYKTCTYCLSLTVYRSQLSVMSCHKAKADFIARHCAILGFQSTPPFTLCFSLCIAVVAVAACHAGRHNESI